jgi:translation initiation factor 1 (eIF-1/SUI1)
MLVERATRAGHAVTVVWNLPVPPSELEAVVRELRRLCATGGVVRGDRIELRGDVTERVRRWLEERGWPYEGA